MKPEIAYSTPELAKAREEIDAKRIRTSRQAVTETTRDAEQALEGATTAASLGRLSKAWASRIYPDRGRRTSEPVGYIYPKGKDRTRGAIRSFTRGARVAARDGGPVAIPLPAAGKPSRSRDGTYQLTPEEWSRRTGQELRPVFRRGKPPLLVADGRVNMRTGRFRKSLKRDARRIGPGFGAVVPIFVLIPAYSHQSRFSIEGVMAPFSAKLAARYAALADEV